MSPQKNEVSGCRRYFLLTLLKKLCEFIIAFDEEIQEASSRDCGNFRDMNLETAKYHVKKYLLMLQLT